MLIIMKIGCLCCNTPSALVASFSEDEKDKAYETIKYLDYVSDSQEEYILVDVPQEPLPLSKSYQDLVEVGKKRHDEHTEKMRCMIEKQQTRKDIKDAYKQAQKSRTDVDDKRIDDNYVKNYVPLDILNRMASELCWKDDEGFWWGFGTVLASKDDKGVYVQLANRYDVLQKQNIIKLVRIDTGEIEEKIFSC